MQCWICGYWYARFFTHTTSTTFSDKAATVSSILFEGHECILNLPGPRPRSDLSFRYLYRTVRLRLHGHWLIISTYRRAGYGSLVVDGSTSRLSSTKNGAGEMLFRKIFYNAGNWAALRAKILKGMIELFDDRNIETTSSWGNIPKNSLLSLSTSSGTFGSQLHAKKNRKSGRRFWPSSFHEGHSEDKYPSTTRSAWCVRLVR